MKQNHCACGAEIGKDSKTCVDHRFGLLDYVPTPLGQFDPIKEFFDAVVSSAEYSIDARTDAERRKDASQDHPGR